MVRYLCRSNVSEKLRTCHRGPDDILDFHDFVFSLFIGTLFFHPLSNSIWYSFKCSFYSLTILWPYSHFTSTTMENLFVFIIFSLCVCVCVCACVCVCVCVCVCGSVYTCNHGQASGFLHANVDLCQPWTSSYFRGGPLDCWSHKNVHI